MMQSYGKLATIIFLNLPDLLWVTGNIKPQPVNLNHGFETGPAATLEGHRNGGGPLNYPNFV